MKSVYIFRGAPATGKGTLAPEFAKSLEKPVALIEQDAFRWNFHLIGRKPSDLSSAEHLFAYNNMLLLYEQYLKVGKYAIVLEGLFTWDNPDLSQGNAKQLVNMAHEHGLAVKSIVLQADKAELLKRNAERQYAVPIKEFEALYDNIYHAIGPDEIVVDSTGQTPDETLSLIKQLIPV